MTRFLILSLLISLSGAASAQQNTIRPGTATPGTQTTAVTTVEAETRAQEEFYVAWKVRYATNRATVAREIKAVRQEIAGIDSSKASLNEQLMTLLNGTIKRWNEEKIDYASPEQFTECTDLFATIRRAIREGALKL